MRGKPLHLSTAPAVIPRALIGNRAHAMPVHRYRYLGIAERRSRFKALETALRSLIALAAEGDPARSDLSRRLGEVLREMSLLGFNSDAVSRSVLAGDFQQALSQVRVWLNRDPFSPEALETLCEVLLRLGRPDEAMGLLRSLDEIARSQPAGGGTRGDGGNGGVSAQEGAVAVAGAAGARRAAATLDPAVRHLEGWLAIPKPELTSEEARALDGLRGRLRQRLEPPAPPCFVATACYGDASGAEVRRLARFRDRILLMSAPGRALVRLYYAVSPPAALVLRRSPVLRAAVRWMLLGPLVRVVTLIPDVSRRD